MNDIDSNLSRAIESSFISTIYIYAISKLDLVLKQYIFQNFYVFLKKHLANETDNGTITTK